MDDPVYYRIMYWEKGEKLTVVSMQSFDECDYNQKHFLRDEDNATMRWDDEIDAVRYLNEYFKPEYIDSEYISPNNKEFFKEDSQFKHMRHT